MNTHIFNNTRYALVTAALILMLAIVSFFAFEPAMVWSQGANPHDFVVSQTISDEVSFVVEAADVTMDGSIQGLSGGYATGTTYAVVTTNNPTGYTVTLAFTDNATDHSMDSAAGDYISDYTPAGGSGTADYDWVDNASGGSAEFGYTVRASTSADVAAIFKDTAGTCGSGTAAAVNKCWTNPTTSATTIISSAAARTLATSTIKFKVAVPNNPSPALPSGVYTATGTLTATTN